MHGGGNNCRGDGKGSRDLNGLTPGTPRAAARLARPGRQGAFVMGLPAQTWPLSAPSKRRTKPPRPAASPDSHQLLLAWALASMAAAAQRVAELEARLAYVEGLTVTDELT